MNIEESLQKFVQFTWLEKTNFIIMFYSEALGKAKKQEYINKFQSKIIEVSQMEENEINTEALVSLYINILSVDWNITRQKELERQKHSSQHYKEIASLKKDREQERQIKIVQLTSIL